MTLQDAIKGHDAAIRKEGDGMVVFFNDNPVYSTDGVSFRDAEPSEWIDKNDWDGLSFE